jgi:excisionase family DNA binding protein
VRHPWYTVREAARLAHIPTRTIYLWIAEERLTMERESRGRLVNLIEVEHLRDLRLPSGRIRRVDKER